MNRELLTILYEMSKNSLCNEFGSFKFCEEMYCCNCVIRDIRRKERLYPPIIKELLNE